MKSNVALKTYARNSVFMCIVSQNSDTSNKKVPIYTIHIYMTLRQTSFF